MIASLALSQQLAKASDPERDPVAIRRSSRSR